MVDGIKTQLIEIKEQFEKLKANTVSCRDDILDQVKILNEKSQHYSSAWSGEWFTGSYNLYCNNFDPTSSEGAYYSAEDIKADLFGLTNIDLDELDDRITPISQQFFHLRDFILAELSYMKGLDECKNEEELIGKIENFKWGIRPGAYINSIRPKYAVTYDPHVLTKGVPSPPHLVVWDKLVYISSLLTSYDNFEKLVHQLIRLIEIKYGSANAVPIEFSYVTALGALFNKFHVVATQLKNRYANRETIKINDEYDVQDIMNALLRVHFEDVRKEEHTPSYAGSAARVDFLLKREQIIIEVKKTRSGLKDKEIGNQLILDIAHYKSHPDCKKLICFVYDPENLINNPRGLEDDLNKNSNDEMTVEVWIRP
jgi:hypothetical protein